CPSTHRSRSRPSSRGAHLDRPSAAPSPAKPVLVVFDTCRHVSNTTRTGKRTPDCLAVECVPYRGRRMIRLDGATVLLQCATGGLAFLWVTTRRREVGLGYGWLLRTIYATFAVASIVVGVIFDPVAVREVLGGLMVAATVTA